MSQEKIVTGEGRELERVFQKAGASRKASARKATHARIISRSCIMDAVEVQAVAFSENIKLVRDCEIQIAPTIGEKLGQFRF